MLQDAPRGRGRPHKPGPSKDRRRAIVIESMSEWIGFSAYSDLDLIRIAQALERLRLVEMKERKEERLWSVDEPTLQKSVSTGKGELRRRRGSETYP